MVLFVVVGIAVVDGYGRGADESMQRTNAQKNIDYVLGTGDLPDHLYDRYYGFTFEIATLLVERLLGLTDSRATYLNRHLLTHLFFLAGGWFCYLLTRRLFGDRRLALFALLLFLLHPRIYAHSFFNSKDIPFLAMFMIALYLVQHAFRRDTVAAFALCGVGVGVLIHLRVMGAVLFAAVAGLRALDLLLTARRRTLVTTAAFVLAAAGTLYAVSPYLWRDPLAIVDAFTGAARHPNPASDFFQGRWVSWPRIPQHYLPTYVAVTTPPAALLLCLIGAAVALGRGAARPGSLLRNTRLRFEWLLLACLTLPVAAVIALNSNIYDGWRQMYFLYAPLCLLVVCGLRVLLAATRRLRSQAAAAWLRHGLSALAAVALVTTAADVVRLHPNQEAYFNFLVDRRTPGHPGRRWDLLYWKTEYRQPLEYLLARYPDSTLYVDGENVSALHHSRTLLPASARSRILLTRYPRDEAPGQPAGFYVNRYVGRPAFGPVVYALRVYRSTVLEVIATDLSLVDQAIAEPYRAAYRAAVAGEPLVRTEAGFDLYLEGGALTYAKESCRPEDTRPGFVLRAVPVEGKEVSLHFHFSHYGVRVDGACLIRRPLPDHPIRTLKVGRGERRDEPSVVIDLRTAGPAMQSQ